MIAIAVTSYLSSGPKGRLLAAALPVGQSPCESKPQKTRLVSFRNVRTQHPIRRASYSGQLMIRAAREMPVLTSDITPHGKLRRLARSDLTH